MSRYRRYIIAGGVLAVLLGLYAVAGFWAVPHFARSQAQDFVRTHYGRTLTIGEIRFNPFTLKLDISDVSLPDADGKTLLSFAHLHVDLQYASLWRLGPSFKEILLDKPYVRAVVRHGGELNLADLGKGFPPPRQPAPPPPKEQKPMRLYIGRLAVTGGSGTFEDLTRADAFKADFNPITFELRDFSTVGSEDNHYALSAASEDGEHFNWSGDLRLAPLTSQGQFEVTSLRARTLWDYVRDIVPLEIDSGLIELHGGYQLAAADGPLSLKVAVHDTTVTDLGIKPKGGPQDYLKLVGIEDRQVKPVLALAVDPLNIHVGGFNTRPDDMLEITVDSTVNGSGKLGARAQVTPRSGDLRAHVEATALALPFLQPYLARYTSM